MRFEVGIDPQTLSYGYQNEIMYHPYSTGVPKMIRSDVPNLMKDVPNLMRNVPNLMRNVPNFVKDIPRVPKCVSRWGSTPNHFLMGSFKSWTIHVQIGDPKTIGSDVPNLMNDVPNFVKNVPRVRKCVLKWGLTPNHLLMGF